MAASARHAFTKMRGLATAPPPAAAANISLAGMFVARLWRHVALTPAWRVASIFRVDGHWRAEPVAAEGQHNSPASQTTVSATITVAQGCMALCPDIEAKLAARIRVCPWPSMAARPRQVRSPASARDTTNFDPTRSVVSTGLHGDSAAEQQTELALGVDSCFSTMRLSQFSSPFGSGDRL